MRRVGCVAVLTAAMTMGVAMPTQAAWPVIDVAAIVQLKEQLTAMAEELDQLKATHRALSGARGMDALLPVPTAARNYLPQDWAEMQRVMAGTSTGYGALARAVSTEVKANAVLTPAFVAGRSAEEQTVIEAGRTRAAWLAAATRQAYAQSSARFGELQALILAVGRVTDAKAAADLQARIASEQAMLANEQAKLELLAQLAQAEEAAQAQRLREAAVAGHGTFAERFRVTLR